MRPLLVGAKALIVQRKPPPLEWDRVFDQVVFERFARGPRDADCLVPEIKREVPLVGVLACRARYDLGVSTQRVVDLVQTQKGRIPLVETFVRDTSCAQRTQ